MNARTQTGISEPGHPLKRLPSVAQWDDNNYAYLQFWRIT
jgi:hypothetical protein